MRHIVVFKFKQGTTEDLKKEVTESLIALKDKIPGILSLESGINDSPENKSKGFTHIFMFNFESKAVRDNYLQHPEHQKFGEILKDSDILEDVFVTDYIPH